MNPFDHSEDHAVKKLLEETAEQIQPSSAFTAQLENRLKQPHIQKTGFNMPTLKDFSSTIGWAFALIALAIAFNWIASQIAPENVPTSGVTEVVTEEATPEPEQTRVQSTFIPDTAAPEPLPTSASLIFGDDFEASLDDGWQWLYEDSNNWRLTSNPGWLEILAGFGSINGSNMNNLLLRPIPEGNFELETRLKFKPEEDLEIAGLLVYENAGNHIQFGHGFCDAPSCMGDGLYFDFMNDGSFASENFATKAEDMEIVYLRLRFEGNAFTAYASENGKEWRLIGVHNNEIKPLFVGLVAGQAFRRNQLTPAQFDYFVINALP